ncbi:AMP-binding protein [Nocardioides sp. CER19]|uniref:class I adenylate-forming enzyme family protein n=1 Tax=Nocardioides sp. CER19 TaxID=3038538 RepID=UPI00244A946E|nr:AMP-binding protein [Nocardioides sp. CER19]MDH2414809.1 AMP-binding protein [Nocardioides sp. CER19]
MNTAAFLLDAAHGAATVMSEAGREHTYDDLRTEAAALAARLAAADLPPGTPVGLVAPNGMFWASAYLAALSRGLVVVPIPVTLTRDEALARLRWVGARAVFLGRRQVRELPTESLTDVLVVAEQAPGDPIGSPGPLEHVAVDPDADAVYMFTSGTTGRPRVARLTHRNLQANTESILGYLDIRPDDRMLVVLPFSYVFGASLLHTHLRAGAAVVIQPNFVYPQSVVEKLVAERCTGFAGVPSTFHLLLRSSSFGHEAVPGLRSVQQAGGRLEPAVLHELLAAQPQARVFVMYGQTEATARLSYLPPEELLRRPGSIGRGIPGVELSVRDEHGEPVAPGQVGEIWARGANVSPGYLDDPEATARKMPDGVLRTGDLARVDEDGYLYVVDRSEDFIKSWGHRVASQDVEAVAMELPDLVSAAAVGVPDAAAGERIEVVAVRRPGSEVQPSDVQAHCRTRLAKHLVPEAVHFVDRLPLNANGKVVKREVRALCVRLAEESVSGLRAS